MGANTIEITEQNIDELVGSDTPILVDFWAEWCGPCKMMNGPLEDIAGDNAGKLSVGKLNIDEHGSLSQKFEVFSIPTMIVFQGGVEKKRLVGARSKAQLVKELAEYIG